MDKQQAEEFKARWQAVAEIELQEQRSASMASRFRQLNAIIAMAMALKHPRPAWTEEDQAVRDRWVKLKDAIR